MITKTPEHARQMRDVYHNIYQDKYVFRENQLADARMKIAGNLEQLEFPRERLANANVLNVGTGRETFVLHEFGARKVHHFDISDVPVEGLNRLRQSDPKYRNIFSEQLDICADPLKVEDGIDLVYLSGVLHHLRDPGAALRNIARVMNPGCHVYFRIYRSGSILWFINDFCRMFIDYACTEIFDEIFLDRFGETAKDRDLTYSDPIAGAYGSLYDNLFVPVLTLFNLDALDGFFAANGFDVVNPQPRKVYDHDDLGGAANGASVCYRDHHGEFPRPLMGDFPGHVDQIRGIDYAEGFIFETCRLMLERLPKIQALSKADRLRLAIDLFWAGQGYQLYENRNATGRPLDPAIADLRDAASIHRRWQEVLSQI
jgi:SAM-dependent methyltransferase